MILTCPSCGTQYVVKDGAIPSGGRQVRCKACAHSWRVTPASSADQVAGPAGEPSSAPVLPPIDRAAAEAVDEPREHFSDTYAMQQSAGEEVSEPYPERSAEVEDERFAEAPAPPPIPPETEVTALAEAAPSGRLEWAEEDDEFSPFARREPTEAKSRSRVVVVAVLVVLIAAIVAGIWFFAPSEWKQRLGIAGASETPLQLMMTHSDRTQLASGNEFLNISGRIINPTSKQQKVPAIHAQLHDANGKVVYSWTIPPPAKSIPPGGSTTFNSAELNIPPAAEELTVTLGEPRA
jgi:predicted Zn finger-like uncharacterized protein